MRIRFGLVIAGIAVIGGIAGVVMWSEKDTVAVTHPVYGPAVLAVYASGTVEPSVTIPVAPRQTARLVNLFVDEGQQVQKGTVMAQFEDSDLQNVVNDRLSALDLAQKQYDRQVGLMKSGAISKQTFDQTVAALNSAKANVAQAQANLGYLKLVAPEDGQVIRRDGEPGELIPAGQAILWMSCCKGYRVSAEVDEEDIPLVTPGLPVLIRADAFPGEVFNGTVQSITPKGDATARSYRVRIALPEQTKLMIGMTAEANIVVSKEDHALLVPASAVVDNTLYTVHAGKVDRVTVTTGAHTEQQIEIKSGITDQDTVIVEAASAPAPGTFIKTRLSTTAPQGKRK